MTTLRSNSPVCCTNQHRQRYTPPRLPEHWLKVAQCLNDSHHSWRISRFLGDHEWENHPDKAIMFIKVTWRDKLSNAVADRARAGSESSEKMIRGAEWPNIDWEGARSGEKQTAAVSPWVKATVIICEELSVVTPSLCTLHSTYTHACHSYVKGFLVFWDFLNNLKMNHKN